MTTLITTAAILAVTALAAWALERTRQLRSERKRDRQNMRRIQTYIDQLPPANPFDRAPW